MKKYPSASIWNNYLASAISERTSQIDILITGIPYYSSISMNAFFDKPTISADYPAESFTSSYNIAAIIIERSYSFKFTLSGIYNWIVLILKYLFI